MPTGLHLWSRTAASNATADSSINWAEGQSPSSVNDSARAMMARVAEWRDDLGGLTTVGASTAYSVSTNRGFASAAAMDKAIITIIPHVTSGADPTLSVDGLTARPIRTATGVNAPSGALAAGTPYALVYVHASAEFILLGTLGAIGALGNTVTVQGAASDFKAFEGISTDAGAAQGPLLDLYRDSASPLAGDNIGAVNFYGKDGAGNKELYARLLTTIADPTNLSEDGEFFLQTMVAGTLTNVLQSSGANIVLPGALTVTGAASVNSLTSSNGLTVSAGAVALPANSINATELNSDVFATQALQEAAASNTVAVTPGTQHFHPSTPKAWALVNQIGVQTLRASYGCSSVTDGGVGRSTVTLSTAFSSTNYTTIGGIGDANVVNADDMRHLSHTISTYEFLINAAGISADGDFLGLSFLGDQ